jgi:peptide/nickel transport system substrate-binding protein
MSIDPKLPDPDPNVKQARSWRRMQLRKFDSKSIARHVRKAESKTTKHANRFLVKRFQNLRAARRHIIAWGTVAGVVLFGIGVQIMLYSNTFTVKANAPGGVYAEGVVGTIDSLNPIFASTSPEVSASKLLFSSLYEYDNTGHLTPDLASTVNIGKDGREYTVTLREDVEWHDGAKLTADDVVFTIETIQDPDTRARASLRANWQDITVEKIDEYTVKFMLPQYAAFVHALTFPVLPEHRLATVPLGALQENEFSTAPVGTGPFTFRLLQNADSLGGERTVHMRANESYYGGEIKLNRFELHAYAAVEDLIDALKAGALSGATDISSQQAKDLEGENYINDTYLIDNGVFALFNNTGSLLRDGKLRRALRMAVDTGAVRDAVGGEVGALHMPFLNGQVESDDLPAPPTFDPKAAAVALDKLGWKLGENGARAKGETSLEFVITTVKNDQYEIAANKLARQLRDIGVVIDVKVFDDTQLNSNFVGNVLQQRNYDILVYELPIGADPDVYAYWHTSQLGASGYNFANYSNDTSDAALSSARDRTDEKLRAAKYATFAQQWLSDAPAIGLYQQSVTYLHRPSTQAVDPTAKFVVSSDRYSNVRHWAVNIERIYTTP